MRRRALIVVAVLLSLAAASPAAADPNIPVLSADAAVAADGITILFNESGLDPRETVSVSVAASDETTYECVTPGPLPNVLFRTTSSASATEVADYTADSEGQVVADRLLAVTAGAPIVSGLPCEMRASYLVTVVVTDLSHGVSVTVERRG